MKKAISIFLLLMISINASADYSYFDRNFSYTGYVSQFYLHTDENNFYKSKDDPFHFREFGIHGTYRLHQNILLSGQLSSTANDLQVEYLMADINYGNNEHAYGIRGGKIKRIFGLYGATQNNSFMRKSMFLPQTVYFDNASPYVRFGLGAMGYYERYFGRNSFVVEVDCAYPDLTDKQEEMVFSQIFAGAEMGKDDKIDNDQLMCTLSSRLNLNSNLRFNLNLFDNSWGVTPDANKPFPKMGLDQKVAQIGVEYKWEDFTFATEFHRSWFDVDVEPPGAPDSKLDVKGYYFLLGYSFTEKLEGFTYYGDFLLETTTDAFIVGSLQPSTVDDTKFRDIAVGLQYNINDNWSVRAEFHHFDGLINLFLHGSDNNLPEVKEEWNLFALGVNFRF